MHCDLYLQTVHPRFLRQFVRINKQLLFHLVVNYSLQIISETSEGQSTVFYALIVRLGAKKWHPYPVEVRTPLKAHTSSMCIMWLGYRSARPASESSQRSSLSILKFLSKIRSHDSTPL